MMTILAAVLFLAWPVEMPLSASVPAQGAVVLREDIFITAPFALCHASTVVETPSGLLTAWFGGTSEGAADVGIWLSRRDEGAWTRPEEIAVGRGADGERLPCWNPVLFLPRRGPLLLFYKVGPNPASWRGMAASSFDHGRTFGPARPLPDGILGPVRNHPIELEGGIILSGSSTEDAGWRVHFERSMDGGRTWLRTSAINDGKGLGLIQPALFPAGGGAVLSLMRSTAGRVYESRSADGGSTWTTPEATSLPNPNSAVDGLTLRDGRFLLVFNPSAGDRSALAVAVSPDGRSWRTVAELEREAGAEFSYPSVIQSADGLVHVVYTWKRLRIRHAVLDPARF